MIVCSCNVFSDHELQSTVAKVVRRPRLSQIYASLGGSAQCGRCARTIKQIMQNIPNRTIGSVAASARHRHNEISPTLYEEECVPGIIRGETDKSGAGTR